MNELSLFSGAGGGLLATQHLLGWRGVGYVENNAYCQGVLARRMEDGFLHPAPIFGDIRRFISDGYAAAYQGMVDVVAAGFPCQPFSVAGKRAGADDNRNMWPATIECVRVVRPRYVFLENVPGLLASGYFNRILSDLSEAGYDAEWCVLGADAVGGNHKRHRMWIYAYANGNGRTRRATVGRDGRIRGSRYAAAVRIQYKGYEESQEPAIPRVANDVANQLERCRSIGNGQVPAVAALAWEMLT